MRFEHGKQFIREHYTEETLSVGSVAVKLFLSQNYYGQLFKSSTGMSVNEYINLARIEHARHLLSSTNLKIYEISSACGYTDQYYFSSVFKKIVGISPSEYRDVL
ncbi:AraC family transcriptional regulator [Diplocloster hominis]|uniref:helix-turn-helix transcriptional regulator n=1 Tax=Diplocloster hominis TaxID=3079010 RepID=UPI0031BA5FA7